MTRRPASRAALASALLVLLPAARGEPPATTRASVVQLPSVTVDLAARQVRVACESLALKDTPLEFVCVTKGGPEHESVLRTAAKPSDVHAGLLMLGMEPGSPAIYRQATNTWAAPFGPPIRVTCEWVDAGGQTVRLPADRMLKGTARNAAGADRPTWVFAGSHVRETDGAYLADLLGYVVTLVNFEHALIDVPRLASSSNETLGWETDLGVVPPRGAPVTMILEPVAGGAASAPATTRATTRPASQPVATLTPETVDREIAAFRDQWRAAVGPREQAIRDAAKTHYEVLAELRKRQQSLVDEADRIQRLIDELERQYGELTTPKPE